MNSFVKNQWGIPEPSLDYIQSHPDVTESGVIDLVIVPGVGFDKHCARLGHGKGYYDCFLSKLLQSVKTIGVALDEQLVDVVPMDDHDRILDYLFTPSNIYEKS
eukprot:gene22062-28558_t